MRILVVHNYYQHQGGEDMVFHQEVSELSKHHEIETLSFQNKRGWKGLIQYALYPWNILATRIVMNKVKMFQPDVVHIHNLHYALGPLVLRVLKKRKLKVVMTLHNYRLICPSATLFFHNQLFTSSLSENFPWTAVRKKVQENSTLKTWLTAFTYYLHKRLGTWQCVDQFLVLSDFSKNLFLSSTLRIASQKITVKPNFVELPINTLEKRRQTDYLYVGRLSTEKGILQLVQAFLKTPYNLRIIGEGPLQSNISEMLKDDSNIQLVGSLNKPQVLDAMMSCRALIIPSVCYEGGVPLTIIEGMATKTPIIASNLGAISEQIVNKKTGWLFDPFNPTSIKDALVNFESSDNIPKIVDIAFLEYQTRYTKKQVISKLIDVYKNLASLIK